MFQPINLPLNKRGPKHITIGSHHHLKIIAMFLDPSNLNVHALRALIKKLTDKYSTAIHNDRPLKDVKEIKKAIHFVERKIAEAEEACLSAGKDQEPRTQEPNKFQVTNFK